MRVSDVRERVVPALVASVASLFVAGCNPAGAPSLSASADAVTPPSRLEARPGVSPRGASVALTSVEGLPGDLGGRFAQSFGSAAAQHDIVIADPKKAAYLVRSYLSTYPVANGTAVAYVFDIFDARKRLTQRVEDAVVAPGSSSDPWAMVNDSVLAQVSQQATGDLAAVLSNTPEAIAAATRPAPTIAVAARSSGGTTVVSQSGPAAPSAPRAPIGVAIR